MTKELQNLEKNMIFPEDERPIKPLVNIDMSCPGVEAYHEESKGLHSLKIKDDIERVKVE